MSISGKIVSHSSKNQVSDQTVSPHQKFYGVFGRTPVIILCMMKALVFSLLFSPVTALDWTTETVDSTDDTGWYTSLALDNSGTPHISYLDWTNHHLKYAIKTDGMWKSETIDTTNAAGEFSSLKLDASSQPLISYYDSNRGNLTCAMKNGDAWNTVIVDSGGVGRYTSLALDMSANPQISYQDLSLMKLKYAVKTGDTWTNETVDNSENVGAYSSLAVDRNNNPHISYYDGGNGDLKYAQKSGGQWINQTIDSTGNTGYYTSIALDGTGNPHISYYDGINRDLKYTTKMGSSWIKENVDTTGSVGKYTSLAIDSSGNPRISYFDETQGHLKYAIKTGIVWTNETADTAVNVGGYTSLALDDTGNPRISYRDSGNQDLKYAVGIPPLVLDFTALSRNGTAPLTVQFSDNSTGGQPSLWNWSFGDGAWFNTSLTGSKNPDHIYETPGTYTVNLTVQNLSVASTLNRPGFVIVLAPSVTTVPTSSPAPTSSPSPSPTTTPPGTPTSTPSPTLTASPVPTSSPTPTFTSSPTSTPSPAEIPGNSDGSQPGVSPLPVPQEAGPLGCQTVNVGGDSAISRVIVTGRGISDIIVTARKIVSLPRGIAHPGRTVYQYIEIIPAHYGIISGTMIEFNVPQEIIEEHSAAHEDVTLCRFNSSTWVCPTARMTGCKNGHFVYRAESPGFSLFAISIRNGTDTGILEGRRTVPATTGVLLTDDFETPVALVNVKTPVPRMPDSPDFPPSFLIWILIGIGLIGTIFYRVLKRWQRI